MATSAGLWLAIGLAAYGGAAAALLLYPLPSVEVPLPEWVPLVAPPLFYVLLALLGLARQSLVRALLGALALCVCYVLLGTGTEALRAIVVESFAHGPAIPTASQTLTLTCLQAVWAPILLVPFRGMLTARPRPERPAKAASRTAGRRGRAASTPAATSAASSRATRTAWASPPPTEPVAAAGGRNDRPEVPAASVTIPEPPPAPVPPPPPPISPAPIPASSPAPARPPGAEPFEGVVRSPFERISEQLPAEIFRVKADRIAENLLEPGFLLVPQRLLTPQLAEGSVQVGWEIVADQFPRQALALSDAEIARRIPNGKLVLPVDEVVRQLPSDLFVLPSPTVDIRGIEEFPAPFQPHFPPPSEERRPGAEAQPVAPPPPVTEPRPIAAAGAERPAVAPAVGPSRSEPKAEPKPAPAEVAALPAAREQPARGKPAAAGTEKIELPELAPLLARLKSKLEVDDRMCEGVRFLTIVQAGIAREAVAATAARIAPFLIDARLPEPVRQTTLRGGTGAVVVTPLGAVDQGGPVVVVAVSSRSSLAMLERLSLRAAADHQDEQARRARPAARGAAKNGATLVDATVPAQAHAVAQSTSAFGPLTPSVLRDPAGSTLIYLFRSDGVEAGPVGQFASDLWGVLREAEIGPASSMILRMDSHSVAVRDLATRSGTTIVVIGGGRVERPGLAYVELDRAAARLGALQG